MHVNDVLTPRRKAVDIALVASVAVSIAFSALAIPKLLESSSPSMSSPLSYGGAVDPGRTSEYAASSSGEQISQENSAVGSGSGAPANEGLREGTQSNDGPPKTIISDPDGNGEKVPQDYSREPGSGVLVDNQLGPAYSTDSPQAMLPAQTLGSVYDSSPYILPITWGAVIGTVIWRGKLKSAWCKQGYDYDTFRLFARMRGSPVRVRMLNMVAESAKNRLQLANELDVDWKTIDNHMDILAKNGLVEEKTIVGTTKYYIVTEHGKRVLSLLASTVPTN